MLEPVRQEVAQRRLRVLQARLAWLGDKLAGGAAANPNASFHLAEQGALQWAIDELVALYEEHKRKAISEGQ